MIDRDSIIEECARIAELFSINKTPIHPDIPWEKMNTQAQMIEHTTCQQVAWAIRELKAKGERE